MNDALTPEAVEALLADTSPYLCCDDCFATLDVYVERRAHEPTYSEPAMETHLAACGACAEEAATLLELLG